MLDRVGLFSDVLKREESFFFFLGRGNHLLSVGSATQDLTHNSCLLVRFVVMMSQTRLDWTHVTNAVSETQAKHGSYPSIHNLFTPMNHCYQSVPTSDPANS